MANVLTDLAADLYKAADIVAREQVGFIPSIVVNGGSEGVAFGDDVRSFATRAPTLNSTYTASMTLPEGDDQTIDNKKLTINKAANVIIPWTGEDVKHVNNGAGFENIKSDQILQAFRKITNQIESDVATATYLAASRAYGTAGTTPFGSNFNELAQIRKILTDNGAPFDGTMSVVMDTSAGANLRSLAQLQKANEAGGTNLLRQGVLLDLQGFMLKESAGVVTTVAGTGTGYLVNGALAVGETAIVVDTGTVGATGIKAGDVITIAGDTNKYVVTTGLAAASGTVTIAAPGLRKAAADNAAITVGAAYAANVALHQKAVELAIRPPSMPQGGDAAKDAMTIQDPVSGLVFEIRHYVGRGKSILDITALYGIKVWKPEFTAILLG